MIELVPLEHPSVYLKEEFLEPLKLTAYKVAKETQIPHMTISKILRGKRGISTIVGLKLAKFFGISKGYFIRLQDQYEIDFVKRDIKNQLQCIKPFKQVACV